MAWIQYAMKDKAANEYMIAVGLQAYMYKNQRDIQDRIAFAWQVHEAPGVLAAAMRSPWDTVVAAASEAPCACKGQWVPMTEDLLQYHCKNFPQNVQADEMPVPANVRAAIVQALQEGCCKHKNVFLYGPNTSGKSHVLKPLAEIFKGYVFLRPVGKGNYPLQQLFGKKVCVLQDVRVNSFKLDFDSLLVWWEGEDFPVPMPRNHHKEDKE
jgi:hypothetical protein